MTKSFQYLKYDEELRKSVDKLGTQPHCDSRILHAPESGCVYCNERPELQEARSRLGINFTGQYDPSKLACPAERERPLNTIEKWGGNVIRTKEDIEEDDKGWKLFWDEIEKGRIEQED